MVALMVHLFTLGFAALGVLLISAAPGFVLTWLIGGFLIAIGVMLRPRLGRVSHEADLLPEASAPCLYGLARRVAAEAGVPCPVVAVHDLGLGATYERVGLRRRPVLTIGLPVWLALSPALRVALLATACAQHRLDDDVVVGDAKATLAEVITSASYLAPMQSAALRGEDVASIRRAALDRAAVREMFSGEPGAPVTVISESEQIDLELRAHYERAVRGLGLLS